MIGEDDDDDDEAGSSTLEALDVDDLLNLDDDEDIDDVVLLPQLTLLFDSLAACLDMLCLFVF